MTAANDGADRRFAAAGAALGAVGVALGAFGAHALRGRLAPAMLEVWRTAVLYHLVHAVALVAVGAVADRLRRPGLVLGLFTTGVALFSGSLYLMALGAGHGFGAVTPFGGATLIAAWLATALGLRSKPR